MEMELTELDPTLNRIRLNGRLDSPGVDSIELRFTASVASAGKSAIVDLSGVSFLASMGIRMLISSARALHLKGAKIVLYGPTESVLSVLNHVALDQIIPIVPSEMEAVARLRG